MVAPFHAHISEEIITFTRIVELRHSGGLSGYDINVYDLDENLLSNKWFASEKLAREEMENNLK